MWLPMKARKLSLRGPGLARFSGPGKVNYIEFRFQRFFTGPGQRYVYLRSSNSTQLLPQSGQGTRWTDGATDMPPSRRGTGTATWTDWLDQNASKGVRRYVPSSVNDVVHAVKNERKLRTIGAGHADNRVGRPDDGTAMIDPQRLSGVSLVKKTPGGALVYIGAGTRVFDVNRTPLGDGTGTAQYGELRPTVLRRGGRNRHTRLGCIVGAIR